MEIKENEKIEDLQYKGLKIIQNKKWFCFGMDAILLSDFAKDIKSNSTVIDLGAGTGIISILLSAKTKAKKIKCVENQECMVDIIERNIKLNKLEDKIELEHSDILTMSKKQKVDVIVTNPPYKEEQTGIKNINKQKHASKFETTAKLDDFIKVSQELLKDKGKIFMVHRPERLVEIICSMKKHKLEPKRLQFVYSHMNAKENAKLVLIEAVKNANPFLKVMENIYVYDEKGNYTDKINEIYHINKN